MELLNLFQSIAITPVLIQTISCVAYCPNPSEEEYCYYSDNYIPGSSNLIDYSGMNVCADAYTTHTTILNGVSDMGNEWLNVYNINIEKLNMMCVLEENWDDEGALPFSSELIEKVRSLLKHLNQYQPDIFPKTDSRIQLEFYTENNRYLKITVSETICDIYSTDNFNYNDDFFETYPFNEANIYRTVMLFYSNNLGKK